jgi:hypothetical protein
LKIFPLRRYEQFRSAPEVTLLVMRHFREGARSGRAAVLGRFPFSGEMAVLGTTSQKGCPLIEIACISDMKIDSEFPRLNISEGTMHKSNVFLLSSVQNMSSKYLLSETCSDSDLHIHDKRVTRLLVLLQQVDESVGGLEWLPAPELTEIVSSAIQICGFVDPIEALEVIGNVLEEIERKVSISEQLSRAGDDPILRWSNFNSPC